MKPFIPRYSTKSKTRRYYACGRAGMTIKQTCDTLTRAKAIAWCHSQICPSHSTHIHRRRNQGDYVITTQVYPKSFKQFRRVLAFTLGVAREIELKAHHYEAAEMIDDKIKEMNLGV